MTREEAIQIFREDKEFYHANKEKILKLIQLNDAKEYINSFKETKGINSNILFDKILEEEINKNKIERNKHGTNLYCNQR